MGHQLDRHCTACCTALPRLVPDRQLTMPNTARSTRSQGSRLSSKRSNYKLLSKTSEVDETLFATQPKGRPRSNQGQNSYVSKDMMASFADASVIGDAELRRLKEASVVRTHLMEQQDAEQAKSDKDKTMAVAKARKDKILAMEEERKKKEAKSDLEMESIEKDKHQLSRADFLVDEQRDDVKKMNQYVKYAKCAAIRDAQLEEKKSLQRQQEEEDMLMDHQMEEEREHAVGLYEQREHQRHLDRIHGKEVITEQIAARERERLLQQGLLEQERDAMLRQLERLKEEDMLKAEIRKEAAKKLMEEVAVSNTQMTKLKELKRQKEKDEDQRRRRIRRQSWMLSVLSEQWSRQSVTGARRSALQSRSSSPRTKCCLRQELNKRKRRRDD